MKLNFVLLLTVSYFIFSNISSFAQVHDSRAEKLDSIHETIVYEYDTIYVAPDTLRITDTVYQYQTKLKKASRHYDFKLFSKIDPFNYLSDKWTAGAGAYFFLSGFPLNKQDTFSINPSVCYNIDFHINYRANFFRYTFGIGFKAIREQLHYDSKVFVSTAMNNGYRDSILYNNNFTSQNYFNYLQLFFNIGKTWTRHKLFFALDLNMTGNLMIMNHSLVPEINPVKIRSSLLNNYSFSTGLFPSIGYKNRRGVCISLVPFASVFPFSGSKYPTTERFMIGVGFRVQ
jgi:hypothetical protein